jgi:vancomycin resistance protein YoaR
MVSETLLHDGQGSPRLRFARPPGAALATGLLVVNVLLVMLLVGSLAAFEIAYANRIYPGVRVWGVDVGGLRLDDAAEALEARVGFEQPLVVLRGAEQVWLLRPADLGLHLDAQATLLPGYQIGRTGSLFDRLQAKVWLLLYGEEFAPVIVSDVRVARAYLEALAKEVALSPRDASLALEGTTLVSTPAQTGRWLDVDATLAMLLPAITRFEPTEAQLVLHEIPPTIRDAEAARAEAEALLAQPLTLVLPDPREGDPGPWVLQPADLAAMIGVQPVDGVLHIVVSEDALRAYLASWVAPSLAIEPVDARFRFNEATRQLEPIQPSQDGRALDVESSLTRVMAALASGERYVPLVLQAVPPRYPATATAEATGIVELVAEGDSYFIGSPSGRDHNIRLAATKFDGIVIPPGETFSFNHFLGEVTAEAGYDEAYVTAGEQLAIEVGGGICQVSTTAFRAAFWGGYPIVERWAHTHRIGYYELMDAGVGMDATVYSPYVDFRFVNDRPYPLLIETEVINSAHRLVFRFYSTNDGRRVEKDGPTVSDPVRPGEPIYQLDENMPPGTVKQWQTAVDGLTATIKRRVYDAAGALIAEDTFVSRYEPRRAAYRYGPGYVPPVEPEASATTP